MSDGISQVSDLRCPVCGTILNQSEKGKGFYCSGCNALISGPRYPEIEKGQLPLPITGQALQHLLCGDDGQLRLPLDPMDWKGGGEGGRASRRSAHYAAHGFSFSNGSSAVDHRVICRRAVWAEKIR